MAAATVSIVGVVNVAPAATTYVISTAGASALGTFTRANSSADNPTAATISRGVLTVGQDNFIIGNTNYGTVSTSSSATYFGSNTVNDASGNPSTSQDQVVYYFREAGSVFGLADLVNSNGLSSSNSGTTVLPKDPNGVLYLWENGVRFTGSGNPDTGTPNIGRTNGANYAANGTQLANPTGQPAVQIAWSDVKFQQAYAISGTHSSTAIPFQAGYGLGNGPTINAGTGNASGTNFQQLANVTSVVGGIDPTTTRLRNQTVAIEAFNIVANPGTGLGQISKSDGQWLNLTGRFQNGANFNVSTRDIGSGTRNEGNLNLGVDPSYGAGERDRIATATYNTVDYNGNPVTVNAGDEASPLLSLSGGTSLNVNENRAGPDIHFSDKISGGSGVRATVVTNRMALGILGGGDSGSGSGTALQNATTSAVPLRALAIDFGNGAGYNQATVANITNGNYRLWSNSQAITVAPYSNPTLNDGTYTTRPILNDLKEQNNGTGTITTNASTYQNLATSAPNGPGIVRKFIDNISNSVATASPLTNQITPADFIMSGGFILPQVMSVTKVYDSDLNYGTQTQNTTLYNAYASGPGQPMYDKTNWAAPNTTNGDLTGGTNAYKIFASANNAVNGATANRIIPITSRTVLAGDFNGSGVRDNKQVSALALAYASPSTYLTTPASGDPRGWNYNGTAVNNPSTGALAATGTNAAPADGLIVLSDFNGQGNVSTNANDSTFATYDGVTRANLLYFLYGATIDTADAVADPNHAGQNLYTPGSATLTINGSAVSLTAAQNAAANGVRYGHLTKNASIDAFNSTVRGFATGAGSTSLGLSPTQISALVVDKFDTNLDGTINRADAKNVDNLVSRDYTNVSDVLKTPPIVFNNQVMPEDPLVAAELIDNTTITHIANTALPVGKQSSMQAMVYHLQGRDVNASLTGNETTGNALLNGDTTFSGTVGLTDYNTVLTNFGKSGQKWSQGNFDFTGNVGLGDYNTILTNFGKTAGLNTVTYGGAAGGGGGGSQSGQAVAGHAAAAGVSKAGSFALTSVTASANPAPTAADVQLQVNTSTGFVTLFDTTAKNTSVISGYEIKSASGKLVPYPSPKSARGFYTGSSLENNPNAVNNSSGNNNWSPVSNISTDVAEGSPSNTHQDPINNSANTNVPTLAAGGLSLGQLFASLGGAPDLTFTWSDGFRADGSVDTFSSGTVIDYVPEPTSLTMIVLSGAALLGRRRRRPTSAVGITGGTRID